MGSTDRQTEMLRRIRCCHLRPRGRVVIMFTNYFRWSIEDTQDLRYHSEFSDKDGVRWTIESEYGEINTLSSEVISRFHCVSSEGQCIDFSYPITWCGSGCYLATLDQSGYIYQLYGDFSGAQYKPSESEYLIIDAQVRG